jgi:hypothetical protein
MVKTRITFLVWLSILTAVATPAGAVVILDGGFFNPLPHTLVTFEIDGRGNPVTVGDGSYVPMPANEYASSGFTFSPRIHWINDASPAFDAAQAIGGSLDIAIPTAEEDDFTISFSVPVQAFGFWVVNNPDAVETPAFQAFGATGLIETAYFDEEAIDGVLERELRERKMQAEYGFLGIAADQTISSIRITKGATNFDNFTFSPGHRSSE